MKKYNYMFLLLVLTLYNYRLFAMKEGDTSVVATQEALKKAIDADDPKAIGDAINRHASVDLPFQVEYGEWEGDYPPYEFPVTHALRKKKYKALNALLSRIVNPTYIDPKTNRYLLIQAINDADERAVEIFLSHGADVQSEYDLGEGVSPEGIPFLFAISLWNQEPEGSLKEVRRRIAEKVNAKVK